MIEIPEALSRAKELESEINGKVVKCAFPPTKEHKFCWFNGEPEAYNPKLKGVEVKDVRAFGIYVEIEFSNEMKLAINDGVNIRIINIEEAPKNYQMLIEFEDGMALVFTVAMYGGIVLHNGDYDNEYYLKSYSSLSPFSKEYKDYFYKILSESKPKLTAKAFLATEQRFPGIGNGVLQDILFAAKINPRQRIGELSKEDMERLFSCVVSVLTDMTENGGRDTEKDIYGNAGRYITKMSKNTLASGCPVCGSEIKKEAYLGGSVYYCTKCQTLRSVGVK